eukprot:10903154-Lingulodinium_polyedra.AAC.1
MEGMYHAGRLRRPLAAAQIDEDNCFGRREWGARTTRSVRRFPRHGAAGVLEALANVLFAPAIRRRRGEGPG